MRLRASAFATTLSSTLSSRFCHSADSATNTGKRALKKSPTMSFVLGRRSLVTLFRASNFVMSIRQASKLLPLMSEMSSSTSTRPPAARASIWQGDDNKITGSDGGLRERSQGRRAIEHDEIIVGKGWFQRLLEKIFAFRAGVHMVRHALQGNVGWDDIERG